MYVNSGGKISPNPAGKLDGIRDSGRQHDDPDMVWQHDQNLLPNHTPLHHHNNMSIITNYSGIIGMGMVPSIIDVWGYDTEIFIITFFFFNQHKSDTSQSTRSECCITKYLVYIGDGHGT